MRLIALLLALLPLPALADPFGDCTDPAYNADFRLSPDKSLACVTIASDTGSLNGQPVAVRAIRAKSTNAAWADPFGTEAVDITLTALATWDAHAAELQLKAPPAITLYITDPEGPGIEVPVESFTGAWADAQGLTRPGECLIRFNTAKSTSTSLDHIRTILAHEAFHCVQAASFAPALQAAGPDSRWWVEGTASFFGNLAHLTETDITDLGTAFATQIQTKPLTQLPYASMTFFAFLWQEGPGTLAQFFAGLPSAPGEPAQMEAVLSSIGPDRLQRFAQAMVDGTVAMPDGTHFPALPAPDTTTFQSDGQLFFPSAPFTILQHALHFTAGNYSLGTGIEFFSRKQGTEDPWETLPFDIAPDDCKDIYMLHIVRFDSDTIPSSFPRPLNATRYLPCWECTKLSKMDQCLVGTWAMQNDSVISFLQSRRISEEVNYNSMAGKIFLTLSADGSSQWAAEGVSIAADYIPKDLDLPFYITVQAFGIDQGEWSGTGGTANLCVTEPGIDLTSTVESSMTGEVKVDATGMAQNMSVAYDCSGNTLAMKYTGPADLGEAAPGWTFERVK